MTAPLTGIPTAGKIGDNDQQARNRTHQHKQDWFTGDGAKTRFALSFTPRDVTQMAVYVSGLRMRPKDRGTAYDFALDGSVLVLVVAPAIAANICVDEVI